MGKRARLKKQLRVEQTLQERRGIEERKNEARSPMTRLVKRVLIALIITVALLVIGQMVNQKIARASVNVEVNQ